MTETLSVDFSSAWVNAMRRGDFIAAWEISDHILEHRAARGPYWELPRHQQWLWDGRSLRGQRVLVHCYHGLGDTLQFARFLPSLAEVAEEVSVWVQPPLLPLVASLPGVKRVLPLHDGTPNLDRDVDIEIMELAHALRVTPSQLSDSVPYVHVAPAERSSTRFTVGMVLTSGEWDEHRSMPLDLFGLLEPEVDWVSFQLPAPLTGMRDWSTSDVLVLASRLRAMDLVISVDTMLAHLAGALALPTWTLLASEADWRWQLDRADTPWYPTMRLFRQHEPGNWISLAEAVHAELQCVR